MTLWEDACAKIDAGDLAGATDSLNQLLEQYPQSPKAPPAQLKLAYIKIRTNPDATQEILNAFALVRTKYPASVEAGEALVRIGYLHSKSDPAQAIDDFTTFLTSYPDHPLAAEVQQSLGRLYLRARQLDNAEAAFDKVKTISEAPVEVAEEAALQSGFVKIMKFYASKNKAHLTPAIDALSKLTSSTSVGIRARADLGVAEAMLLMGNRLEAREKYIAAAQAYSAHPYFRGIALYGVAFSSQEAGDMDQAVSDYAAFLTAQPGSTLAEKNAGWKAAALGSVSPRIQVSIEKDGDWESLPGIEIVRQSAYNQGRCLYLMRRYDEAIVVLTELVEYLPQDDQLRSQAAQLLARCQNAIGGR